MYHNVLHVFHDVLLWCLASHATIGNLAAGDQANSAAIGDNSAGIGDNSAEIGHGAAGIVDIAHAELRTWSHAELRPEWRQE